MDLLLGELQGPGLVVAGLAGVGKSRLARELAQRCRAAGPEVLTVLATASARRIPLGCLAQIGAIRAGAAQSQAELLQLAEALLVARGQGRRPLLLVDDAHLVDPVTAALLVQLATRRSVVLLVTVRSGEVVPAAVAALWKEALLHRVDLQPLARGECAQLIAAALGGAVDPVTAGRLWRLSEGNVLWLRELVLAARARGELRAVDGRWTWDGHLPSSPGLQALVHEATGRLDRVEQQALELLALSEPLELSLLQRLVGEAVVTRLEQWGLLAAELHERRVLVRVGHPLYAESVAARLGTVRSRDLHRQLAEALVATGARRGDDRVRLARWQLHAGLPVDAKTLIDAGHRLMGLQDDRAAVELGQAALRQAESSAAHALLGEALSQLGGDPEAGDAHYQRAISLALAATPPDWEGVVAVTALRCTALLFVRGRAEEAAQAMAALDGLPLPPRLRREADSAVTQVLYHRTQAAAAVDLATDVLADPTSSSRAVLRCAAVGAMAAVDAGRHDWALRTVDAYLPQALQEAEAVPIASTVLVAARLLAIARIGRLHEAGATAKAFYEATEAGLADQPAGSTGPAEAQTFWATGRGLVAATQGSPEALQWFREAADNLRRGGAVASMAGLIYGGLCTSLLAAGDLDGAEQAWADGERTLPGLDAADALDLLVARPWLLACRGELTAAREAALSSARRWRASGALHYALVSLHDAARLGAARAAAVACDEVAAACDGPWSQAAAAHVQALAEGDPAQLAQVGETFEQLGALLLAGEAAGAAAHRFDSAGLAGSALAQRDRARRLLAACSWPELPSVPRLAAEQLTPREDEVARLAARGLTNPEIAERLVLSRRTVGSHLYSAFAKLGVSSRAELAGLFTPAERPERPAPAP